MFCVLFAERAVFGNDKPVGVVALVFIAVIVAVLTFCALEGDFCSYLCLCCHFGKLRTKKLHPFLRCKESLPYKSGVVNLFFNYF